MAEELICNYKKCRKRLGSFGWVTSCSHIYCDEDGTREFSKSLLCPACNTNLPGKFDLIRIDLCPSEQHKSMVLAGQKPEVIMEACSRAMAFWSYQIHQERVYQEYTATKAKQRGTQLEQYYEQLLTRAQSEVTSLKNQISAVKKELETTKKQYSELAEKAKEKSRQHQKLQMMYDALRRQSISMSSVDTREGRNDKNINNNFGPAGFQVFPCAEDHHSIRHIQYQHRCGPEGDMVNRTARQSPPEREFVLQPAADSAASTPQHRTRANLSAVQDRFNSDFIGTPNDISRTLGHRKL